MRVTTNSFVRWTGLRLGCVLMEDGEGDHEQLRSVGWYNAGLCHDGKR